MNVYVCIYSEGPPSKMRFSYADAAPKADLVAASFEHNDSQTHSPLPNCEETNCNRLCLRRHVAGRQAKGENPHVDKLQGCNATRNYIFPEPQARM